MGLKKLGKQPVERKHEITAPIQKIHNPLSCSQIEAQINEGGMDPLSLLKQFKSKQAEKRRVELPTFKGIEKDVEEILLIPKYKAPKKMKLLRFHDNQRPSYFGTFSKKSKIIKGRNPLAKDAVLFNYEVDSDDEWEEEPEGEDLGNSGDEKEKEREKEDEEQEISDDEVWMVPDGYLSENEGAIDPIADTPEMNVPEVEIDEKELQDKKKKLHDEAQKQISKNSKKEILKPTYCGVFFDLTREGTHNNQLTRYKIEVLVDNLPIDVQQLTEMEIEPKKSSAKIVPDSVLPELVKFINGKSDNLNKILQEFKESHSFISKTQLELKIKEIATKEKRLGFEKACWFVNSDLLKTFGIPDAVPTGSPVKSPIRRMAPTMLYTTINTTPSPLKTKTQPKNEVPNELQSQILNQINKNPKMEEPITIKD